MTGANRSAYTESNDTAPSGAKPSFGQSASSYFLSLSCSSGQSSVPVRPRADELRPAVRHDLPPDGGRSAARHAAAQRHSARRRLGNDRPQEQAGPGARLVPPAVAGEPDHQQVAVERALRARPAHLVLHGKPHDHLWVAFFPRVPAMIVLPTGGAPLQVARLSAAAVRCALQHLVLRLPSRCRE